MPGPVPRSCPALTRRPSSIALGSLAVLLTCASFLPRVAHAVPNYEVDFRLGAPTIVHTGSTPYYGTDAWSSGNTTFKSDGYATPGRIHMHQNVTTAFGSLFSEGAGEESRASAQTDDFVITGPAGPTTVSATLHFTTHVHLELSGGYPNNNAQNAQGWFNLVYYDPSAPVAATGNCLEGNYGLSASGFLSGFTPPGGDYPTTITTSFPVGTPFPVIMSLSAAGQTYGSITYAPGIADADFAAEIGDASGHVMDLPAGYTLNSASWGIANDQLGVAAAVESPLPGSPAFLGASPDPASGAMTLTFALPRESVVGARVFDLAGRVVRGLGTGRFTAGTHALVWDGRGDDGQPVAPGVYFVRLDLERGSLTRRIVRVR